MWRKTRTFLGWKSYLALTTAHMTTLSYVFHLTATSLLNEGSSLKIPLIKYKLVHGFGVSLPLQADWDAFHDQCAKAGHSKGIKKAHQVVHVVVNIETTYQTLRLIVGDDFYVTSLP